MDGEDLDIDLPSADAGADAGVEVVKAAPAGETVDDGIETIRKQLATEKAERLAAEARALREAARGNEAEERAISATRAARDSDMHLVTGAIDQLKKTQDLLEERYADAAAAGDHRAMAKITREFSTNGAKLEQLELGKQEMERTPKEEPRRQREISNDPVEQMAGQMDQAGFTRSARWLREHPDYARDPKLTRKMMAAHNLADADGIAADTDAYFEAIETTLGMRGAPGGEDVVVQDTPRQRQSAPPAAPASRASSTSGSSTNSNKVRLTAEEVEMAEMMGMSPQEYAKNKVALKSEGRLN